MTEQQTEITEETQDLAAETLKGDVRDWYLDRVKQLQKPWQQMGEAEQRSLIYDAESAAADMVRKAVRILAAEGRKVIVAQLEQVTVKDGIKAVVTLSKHDACRHELVDAQGKDVLIVVADAGDHMGEKAAAKPDAEEPPLPLEDAPVFDNTEQGRAA
jgi:hypothetical protein